ncbi:hypothetical protein C8R44DRAFT_809467 [Mycena epipterygia]|nr:hypothetical protein C8R44DRAFT_809467 [Mycena epipterygia]
MGLSWCNLVLTVSNNRIHGCLQEHVIRDAESAYGINQLPHKTVLESLQEDSQVFSRLRP